MAGAGLSGTGRPLRHPQKKSWGKRISIGGIATVLLYRSRQRSMADQVLIVDDDRRLSALLKMKQSAKEINMSRFTGLAMAAIIASSLPSFALSDEYNRSLNVKNDSDVAVVLLFIDPIRPEGRRSSSDLIGPSYLNPGFKKSVKIPDGFCRFRVLTVYEDDHVFVIPDIDLCNAVSLSLGRKRK
ncbi:hypothetical protein [Mesorhizobium sp.]|uniref:hypothetical protein n=2 Tax=Mesorhizobium sp. TaxID=1871066 RepID=UPI002580EB4A|nr:hypothetical protein [Mesorhizobium sp.]